MKASKFNIGQEVTATYSKATWTKGVIVEVLPLRNYKIKTQVNGVDRIAIEHEGLLK